MGDNLYADAAAHPSYTLRLEPLTMLAALSTSTSHIGLGATVSTTYSDPFSVARVFASLDHISDGRAAWNAVTTAAEDVTVLPGVMPVVGRTDKEAFEKLNTLQSFVSGSNALAILSDRFGRDMSAYDLDGPIPDIAPSDSYHSFASVMLAKGRRENMTLRDLYNLTAAARGHWVLCGSAERIADTLQLWFEERAADGFNVMPPYFHEGFEDFVELVVPVLQERGLFRSDYEGTTLRDHLGLARPANPFFTV